MRPEPPLLPLLRVALACAVLCSYQVQALPDDARQVIDVEAPAGSSSQADGWTVLKGTASAPARITQGSMVITGMEIRILQKNNELQTATATGNPARFQQQPARDKPLLEGSGKKIHLDSSTKIVTIDDDGELSQAGKLVQSSHIEIRTDTGENNTGPVRMTIQPRKDDSKQ